MDFITKIESAAQQLHEETIKSNLTKSELNALKPIKNEPDIIILPADKGNATVILDKTPMIQKSKKHLMMANTHG